MRPEWGRSGGEDEKHLETPVEVYLVFILSPLLNAEKHFKMGSGDSCRASWSGRGGSPNPRGLR